MSKRLQVVMNDQEYNETRELARKNHQTTAEWVRSALREARRAADRSNPSEKMRAVHEAARFSFPVSGIEQMLEEIETGYTGGKL